MKSVNLGYNVEKDMLNLAKELSDFIILEQFQLLVNEINREDNIQDSNCLIEENDFNQGSVDKAWKDSSVQVDQQTCKNLEVGEVKFDFS